MKGSKKEEISSNKIGEFFDFDIEEFEEGFVDLGGEGPEDDPLESTDMDETGSLLDDGLSGDWEESIQLDIKEESILGEDEGGDISVFLDSFPFNEKQGELREMMDNIEGPEVDLSIVFDDKLSQVDYSEEESCGEFIINLKEVPKFELLPKMDRKNLRGAYLEVGNNPIEWVYTLHGIIVLNSNEYLYVWKNKRFNNIPLSLKNGEMIFKSGIVFIDGAVIVVSVTTWSRIIFVSIGEEIKEVFSLNLQDAIQETIFYNGNCLIKTDKGELSIVEQYRLRKLDQDVISVIGGWGENIYCLKNDNKIGIYNLKSLSNQILELGNKIRFKRGFKKHTISENWLIAFDEDKDHIELISLTSFEPIKIKEVGFVTSVGFHPTKPDIFFFTIFNPYWESSYLGIGDLTHLKFNLIIDLASLLKLFKVDYKFDEPPQITCFSLDPFRLNRIALAVQSGIFILELKELDIK